jgi:hypothetical protein
VTVRLLIVTAVALAATLAIVPALARRRWNAASRDLRRRLVARATAPEPATFSATQLDSLPAPVARYLRAVLRDGQAVPRHVRIEWAGEFNMGRPGADRWVPFFAAQDFVPGAPGFVWDARMRTAGLTVNVRDGFVDGEGSMLGKVLGLVTVVDKHGGDALAVAALQRYLGEAIWLPTALLPGQGVLWQAVDERRAKATVTGGGARATLEFSFGADGLVESVYAAARSYDDGRSPPSLHPWQARVLRYAPLDGVVVPAEAVVEWLLPAGAYAYWRGRPLRIVCDDSASD